MKYVPIFLVVGVLGVSAGTGQADDTPRPNVLFIIADDLNCDLGCYGHKTAQTPNLDRLAASGVRFERGYVQYTVCNPSRTSFLTGLRPTTTKIVDNSVHFRKILPDVVTLPQFFRKNGYQTLGLGKVFHRGLSPDDLRPEWDDPLSFDRVFYGKATPRGNSGTTRNMSSEKLAWCYWRSADGSDVDQADGQTTAEAIKFLVGPHPKPFFLALGYYRPHDPFQSPKKYFDLYDPSKLEIPRVPPGYVPPYPFSVGGGGFKLAFDQFTDQDRREYLHAYYAGVSFVDAQVGLLMEALEKHDLAKNTVIVFLGDHGYELGVRNWWGKNTLFERSCRTPLIVRSPNARGAGQATNALVEFVDLYPTLADLCALPNIPKNLEGLSFRKVLDVPTTPHRKCALTVRQGGFMGRSIRTERFRYTEWDEGKKGLELYDHETDPGEWKNQGSNPELETVRKELAELLRRAEIGTGVAGS
jgi:uncharacterized sulfatase